MKNKYFLCLLNKKLNSFHPVRWSAQNKFLTKHSVSVHWQLFGRVRWAVLWVLSKYFYTPMCTIYVYCLHQRMTNEHCRHITNGNQKSILHQWHSVPHLHDATSRSDLSTLKATCDCLARASQRVGGHLYAASYVDAELSALSRHVVVMLHAAPALVVHLQVYCSLPLQECSHFNNANKSTTTIATFVFTARQHSLLCRALY